MSFQLITKAGICMIFSWESIYQISRLQVPDTRGQECKRALHPKVLRLVWGFWEAFHERITENETADRAKSEGGRLKLNMPTPYVYMAFHEVTCIAGGCTQNVSRQQQFHMAPAIIITTKQCCRYTTSVAVQNVQWKTAVTYFESPATRVQWVLESREYHYIKVINNNKSDEERVGA